MLDFEPEEETGFTDGPGAVAVAVEEDRGAEHVDAGAQLRGQIERIGLRPARVSGSGSPLDALAVDFESIPAVGGDPAGGAPRFGRQGEFTAEQDERVLEGAARGIPEPSSGGQIGQPRPAISEIRRLSKVFGLGDGTRGGGRGTEECGSGAGGEGGRLEETTTVHG